LNQKATLSVIFLLEIVMDYLLKNSQKQNDIFNLVVGLVVIFQ